MEGHVGIFVMVLSGGVDVYWGTTVVWDGYGHSIFGVLGDNEQIIIIWTAAAAAALLQVEQ